MRAFLGIPIPDGLREKIKNLEKEFEMKGVKTVKPENLHWTVKFFGDITEEEAEKVKKIMDGIDFEPLEISVSGIGVFPNISYVKTIWIGAKEKEKFEKLLNEINKKFSEIRKETRKITAHLTICRVKFLTEKEKLVNTIKKHENIEIGKMVVNSLVLYESKLTSDGPIYKKIKVIK